jgi:hypothetical protein
MGGTQEREIMDSSEAKWFFIGLVGIALVAWGANVINTSSKCAVERAAMENGYIQKRVGDDLLWVKE